VGGGGDTWWVGASPADKGVGQASCWPAVARRLQGDWRRLACARPCRPLPAARCPLPAALVRPLLGNPPTDSSGPRSATCGLRTCTRSAATRGCSASTRAQMACAAASRSWKGAPSIIWGEGGAGARQSVGEGATGGAGARQSLGARPRGPPLEPGATRRGAPALLVTRNPLSPGPQPRPSTLTAPSALQAQGAHPAPRAPPHTQARS
jgi:hypothetical protein